VEVQVPRPDDPSVIERTCDCGAKLESGATACPKCPPESPPTAKPTGAGAGRDRAHPADPKEPGLAPDSPRSVSSPPTAEVDDVDDAGDGPPPLPPESAGRKPEEKGSARVVDPSNGPLVIPQGYSLHGRATVKFTCFCGKRVSLEYRQYGLPGKCPRCQAELVFPELTREEKVWVYCPCESLLVSGRNDCPACNREVIRKTEAKRSTQTGPAVSPPKPLRPR